MRRRSAIAVVALAFAACAASLPIERREYILSRPHGWIELDVADSAIPMVPASDEDPTPVRPSACYLDVRLDREPFVNGMLYPNGDAEPFHVRSGFRFPVPVGAVSIALAYSGCDAPEREGEIGVDVTVAEGMVSDLSFDGDAVVVGRPRPDTAVTLERIYDAVSDGRRER